LAKIETKDTTMWGSQSPTGGNSSIVSPTPSNQSIQSGERRSSSFQHPTAFPPPSRMSSNEWRNLPGQTATADIPTASMQQVVTSDQPIKVQKRQVGDVSSWIEAVGVDYNYQPPAERVVKPGEHCYTLQNSPQECTPNMQTVACFYVQPRMAGEVPENNYYRAIYLMQRTIKDFNNAVAGKSNIEPTQVVRTIRINPKGINILMDDESIKEMPEGQDMVAEFHETKPQSPMKREWDAGPTDIQVDGDVGTIENVVTMGYELKLFF
jgi:hypothetical protein